MKYVLSAIVAVVLVAASFSAPALADNTDTITPQNNVGGPEVVSYVQAPLANQTTKLDFTWDPKGQAGLLAIADIISYGGSAPVISAPEGWTLIRDDSAPKDTRQTLYWHVMSADDPATLTWDFGVPVDAQGAILMIDRADSDSPIDASTGNNAHGFMPDTVPVTASSSGDLILSFYSTNFVGPSAPGPVFPDNVNPIVDEESLVDAYWILSGYQNFDGSAGDILVYGVQLYDWVATEVAVRR